MTTTPTRNGFPADTRSAAALPLQGPGPDPLPVRSKKPDYEGWPSLRVTLESLDQHFPSGETRERGHPQRRSIP